MKSVLHPDGTIDLHTHALQGDNRLVTIDSGTGTGTLTAVTDGTRTVSTYTQDDTLIQETIRDIASGVLLSARQAIAFDANDQPTRWAYDNDPDDYSETLNGCCGIDSTRTRDGVTTTYTRDGLKRPKSAISQGITHTYTYGSKTLGGTVFPTVKITTTAGDLTLDQGTAVLDHAGNTLQQISPDLDGDATPESTTTTRDFATRTTTITYQNWMPVTQSRLDTANNIIESTTTTHDALRRPITQTHSRTGLVTTNYATSGQVASIDDHGRRTAYAYDSMGRRTATTLPDTTVTRTSYWPTGQEKATWGSQTNPTVKFYSPEGQLTELRTFRSANLALAPDESTGSYDATTSPGSVPNNRH